MGAPSPQGRARARVRLLPPAIVVVLSLLGSLSVHLPMYVALGALASSFVAQRPSTSPVEIELWESAPSDVAADVVPRLEPPPSLEPERRPRPAEPPPERLSAPDTRAPEPELRAVPDERPRDLPAERDERPRDPPDELDERRAIVQREADGRSPDEARFIAERANDADEETVAAITNAQRDEPDPTAAAPDAPDPSEPVPGDGAEDRAADLRDVEGDDRRVATPASERAAPAGASGPSSSRPSEAQQAPEEGGRASSEAARLGERAVAAIGGPTAQGGEPRAAERGAHEIVVSDAFGTFAVRRVPEQVAPGDGRGEDRAGRAARGPADTPAVGSPADEFAPRQPGVRLGLSWSQFEALYGEETLARERQARLEERRSHARGSSRRAHWEQFRAAIENYVPEVRPGNQTALDAAASPFATFLHDMHQRIHREFAERYLGSLGLDAPEGLNDMSLQTTLEIAVDRDGSLYRVGVVATSGNILFDYGAFAAVMRAQPFPRPPEVILSGDGHAWMHWRFDRGPRHCGTWNARPFLLANAPLIDRGEPPAPPRDEGSESSPQLAPPQGPSGSAG